MDIVLVTKDASKLFSPFCFIQRFFLFQYFFSEYFLIMKYGEEREVLVINHVIVILQNYALLINNLK